MDGRPPPEDESSHYLAQDAEDRARDARAVPEALAAECGDPPPGPRGPFRDALIAWPCGPEHVIRCLNTQNSGLVRVTRTRDGRTASWNEEKTRPAQAAIESGIDDYLAEAGVPGQPFGYRWFVELPTNTENGDDLFSAFEAQLKIKIPGPRIQGLFLQEFPILRGPLRRAHSSSSAVHSAQSRPASGNLLPHQYPETAPRDPAHSSKPG
ncbi:DUF5956 family protein [Allosalinactinospora lopnorensis]|uniref:DUF5956 family protein n=1 Tax=Allosalinactinospora lopnorensis TaxID=1352348 RepID=UPI00373FCBD3